MNPKLYSARPVDVVPNKPGTWNSYRIGVFRTENGVEEQIGSYVRNYSFLSTFWPFERNGKHLALYSPSYSHTRILSLPDCVDLGGEEKEKQGFCPTDLYVPAGWREPLTHRWRAGKEVEPYVTEEFFEYDFHAKPEDHDNEYENGTPITDPEYCSFGFVAGCYWGDDTSWKIQYLDLSEADKGIVKRDERFGYIALAPGLRLSQAVRFGEMRSPDEVFNVYIATEQYFKQDGAKLD